jgi:hypothetical protein
MHKLEVGENRLGDRELLTPATPTASRPHGTSDVLHRGSLADRARKDSVRLALFVPAPQCGVRVAPALPPPWLRENPLLR